MKIYQVNVVCGSGSTGKIVTYLAESVKNEGGECRIAYGRGECKEKNINCIKVSTKIETYIHAFMTRITDRHGLYSKMSTKRLIKDIQKYSPDLIHLHNLHGYYLNYKVLFDFLGNYNRPVVWTMHDCWAFTGHCAHYDSVGCRNWKYGCEECINLGAYPKTKYRKQTGNNYKNKDKSFHSVKDLTIVTPSVWLKEQLKESFLADIKCVVIPNGIDVDKFKGLEIAGNNKRKEKGKVLLGVASPWTKNKGLYDFMRLRDMLEYEYAIYLVGLTQKQIKELPEGIIGVGKINDIAALAEYYFNADVFLNLTYEETLSTTNIEALACGTPVITYNTGGCPEVVSNDCGFIVKKGDLKRIVEIVENELKDKEYYKEACLKKCVFYRKDLCYEKYMNLYKEVIEKDSND